MFKGSGNWAVAQHKSVFSRDYAMELFFAKQE
jgi:hypothetical protein